MLGDALARRMQELRKKAVNFKSELNKILEGATINAVDAATQATPPHNAELAGTNARGGTLSESWTTSSKTKPVNGRTILANNMQYASYVNDGHRVDKHFVPGLHVEGGRLAYDANFNGGIVVGTRTTFVPGRYMKEAGIKEYTRTVEFEIDRAVERGFR